MRPARRSAPDVAGIPDPLRPEWPKNRLGLARWLVDRDNPLTARVAVNRFWQMFFGIGIVKTVEDFGSQGEWPSIRTARLAGRRVHGHGLGREAHAEDDRDERHVPAVVEDVTPELLQRDPENRLLARGPRFRLSAEMIRDQALAASGLLVEKVGGPSVKPYQPAGLWQELQGGEGYKEDKGEGLYRRSLYTFWKRTVAPPIMVNFDSPTRETCVVRENRTNTPLQALNLMNDVTFLEAARKLAERMIGEGGSDPAERIDVAYPAGCWPRPQKTSETVAADAALEQVHGVRIASDPEAGRSIRERRANRRAKREARRARTGGLHGVASMILNLDEAVTKE